MGAGAATDALSHPKSHDFGYGLALEIEPCTLGSNEAKRAGSQSTPPEAECMRRGITQSGGGTFAGNDRGTADQAGAGPCPGSRRFATRTTTVCKVNGKFHLLDDAEAVARILTGQGLRVLLIGAGAMAAHHYVRLTRDLDLAVAVSTSALKDLARQVQSRGWTVECRLPGADDPLDGVVDILTGRGLVQIVNFGGTFPAVISDALASDPQPVRPGSPILIMPLPHLIVLKLYAGGSKSRLDMIELLRRNEELDRKALAALCRRYRLRGLTEILREADSL